MADVWISRKRWTCTYCNLTINDDVPSRRQHENGMRHKNNVERALKGFYRKGELEKRDADYAKREMDKIKRQAAASYAIDQAAASASTSAAPQPPAPPADHDKVGKEKTVEGAERKAQWSPEDKLAAYSTAQSLGYQEDPELLRRQREEAQRKDEGFAGQWEPVAPTSSPDAGAAVASDSRFRAAAGSQQAASSYTEPLSERQEARSFKLGERRAPGLGDQDDDDVDGFASIRTKKRIKVEMSNAAARREDEARARMLPAWHPVRLEAKREKALEATAKVEKEEAVPREEDGAVKGEQMEPVASLPVKTHPEADQQPPPPPVSDTTIAAPASSSPPLVKEEGVDIKAESATSAPAPEDVPAGGGGLFKRRRAGAGAGAKRVRALV